MSLTPVNPAELLPVPTSIYQALAEFNHAFEKLIRDLDTLKNLIPRRWQQNAICSAGYMRKRITTSPRL